MLYINTRCTLSRTTGVQRYTQEIMSRLTDQLIPIQPQKKLSGAMGHLWEQATLPITLLNKGLWCPANSGPILHNRQVCTIHDTSVIEHPEWFSRTYSRWYQYMLPKLAKNARAIITGSSFAKERIIEVLNVPDRKIHVIYHGVSIKPTNENSHDNCAVANQTQHPFFLTVGTLEPRKNLSLLLDAWKEFNTLTQRRIKLKIIGGSSSHFQKILPPSELLDVEFLGHIDDNSLIQLYKNTLGFIYLSSYEGFGLPVLEAMHLGAPTITSMAAAIREVSDGAALYIDTHHREKKQYLINAMLSIYQQPELRIQHKELGHKVAARYSWDKAAKETLLVLENYLL